MTLRTGITVEQVEQLQRLFGWCEQGIWFQPAWLAMLEMAAVWGGSID
jgi:hypothetical protein